MRVCGVMSGTSLDGIDVAIVDVNQARTRTKIDPLAHHTVRYPKAVREAVLSVSNTMTHTAVISRLHVLLGELYAEAIRAACRRAAIPLESIELIGLHGQTIFHEPDPASFLNRKVASTFQIGDPAVVAERTGIQVISNFRERDVAAGGNGAPLVPFVDYLLFRDARQGRIALNIGGIANLTLIAPGAPPEHVIAFDTGPGNMVIDALVHKLTEGKKTFDRNGSIARKGKLHDRLLSSMLSDRYFLLPPPKTTGRERFGQEFVSGLIATGLPLEDLIATATELTAQTITEAIAASIGLLTGHRAGNRITWQVIASGGGIHNRYLMERLASLLHAIQVPALNLHRIELTTTAAFGIDPGAKEAIAFAVLAHQFQRGLPGNLPSATGARRGVILGRSTP